MWHNLGMMKEQVYENTFSLVYQEIKRAGAQKCNIPKSIAKEKIEKKKIYSHRWQWVTY